MAHEDMMFDDERIHKAGEDREAEQEVLGGEWVWL